MKVVVSMEIFYGAARLLVAHEHSSFVFIAAIGVFLVTSLVNESFFAYVTLIDFIQRF